LCIHSTMMQDSAALMAAHCIDWNPFILWHDNQFFFMNTLSDSFCLMARRTELLEIGKQEQGLTSASDSETLPIEWKFYRYIEELFFITPFVWTNCCRSNPSQQQFITCHSKINLLPIRRLGVDRSDC
jgi:hypothetical protein